MRVTWSPTAIADLRDIYTYIAADNPEAADRMRARIITAAERLLSDYYAAGRNGRIEGTRELVVPRTRYVVPYKIKEDEVLILRVVHGARSWPAQT